MAHRVASLDLVDEDEASLLLAPEDDGYAVVVRRRGRPIGFVLADVAGARRQREVRLADLVDEVTAHRAVAAAMRDELPRRSDEAALARLSLTIAICTKDRPSYVARCLESLLSLGRNPEGAPGQVEILVVDNAPSTDETRDVVGRYPKIRYVREDKPGLNFARNRALAEGSGELVAFLDDDVVVDAGWLQGLAMAWLDHPRAGLFTGQVLPLELATPAQLLFERRGGFRRGFERVVLRDRRGRDPYYPCSAGVLGTGANMAVRRDVAQRLGGFDAALDTGAALPGGGDLDMFYRVVRAGCETVYEPTYLVFHQHRRDMDGLRRQYRNSWGVAFMAFAMKSLREDPPMRGRWLGLVGWWFGKQGSHFVQSLVGRHARPPGLVLQETWGGVVGLFGAYGRSRRRVARIAGASQ